MVSHYANLNLLGSVVRVQNSRQHFTEKMLLEKFPKIIDINGIEIPRPSR
jgi:hypothetical protein